MTWHLITDAALDAALQLTPTPHARPWADAQRARDAATSTVGGIGPVIAARAVLLGAHISASQSRLIAAALRSLDVADRAVAARALHDQATTPDPRGGTDWLLGGHRLRPWLLAFIPADAAAAGQALADWVLADPYLSSHLGVAWYAACGEALLDVVASTVVVPVGPGGRARVSDSSRAVQRAAAVGAVLGGLPKKTVAGRVGVTRSTLDQWLTWAAEHRPPTTRDEWLATLDAETAHRASAADAVSRACSAGVFGRLGLDTGSDLWDDEQLVVVADTGWTARHDPDHGWV